MVGQYHFCPTVIRLADRFFPKDTTIFTGNNTEINYYRVVVLDIYSYQPLKSIVSKLFSK